MAAPFKKLVAYLPCARAFELAPAWRCDRLGCLGVHACARRESRRQALERRREGILSERWIEEYHVKCACAVPQVVEGIAEMQLHRAEADRPARLVERVECGAIVLHH